MRVFIRTREGKSFLFPVPLWLVRFGLRTGGPLAARIGADRMDESTRKILEAIDFKLLAECFKDLKQYKGVKIIQLKSSSGEEVEITL